MEVTKKCPSCGWRIFDRITPTTGMIEMKCPRCHQLVRLNLAFRCKTQKQKVYHRSNRIK